MFCFEVMSLDARGSAGDFTLVNLLLFGVSRSCHIFCIRFPAWGKFSDASLVYLVGQFISFSLR